MREGRGGEINSLWVRGQKIRETVTTSLCLMFMALHVVAPTSNGNTCLV